MRGAVVPDSFGEKFQDLSTINFSWMSAAGGLCAVKRPP